MIYAHYDGESGRIMGLYDDRVHSSVPAQSIEITQGQHADIVAAFEDYRVSGGALVHDPAPPQPTYRDMTAAKRAIVAAIAAAERQATDEVTPGEIASWAEKAPAAEAFVAGTATAEQTAMIAAEAGETGETDQELAELIIARAVAFRTLSPRFAGIRRSAFRDLAAADDAHALAPIVEQAVADINSTTAAVLAAQQQG